MWALIENGAIVKTVGDNDCINVGEWQYSPSADKSTIPGLVKVVEPTPPDATQFTVTGSTVTLIAGVPTLAYATEAVTPPAPPPAPAAPTLQQQARTSLNKVTGATGTIIRCVTSGIAVPPEWQDYVKALRAIVNGSDTTSTALPAIPAYPAGT